jgi:hypothetical protein
MRTDTPTSPEYSGTTIENQSAREDTVVTVYLYSDGETDVTAPNGITVNIEYMLAEGDTHCGCGCVIYRDEYGQWLHRDAPEVWGDDHPAHP